MSNQYMSVITMPCPSRVLMDIIKYPEFKPGFSPDGQTVYLYAWECDKLVEALRKNRSTAAMAMVAILAAGRRE